MARYARSKPRAWDMDEDEPFRPYISVDENEAIDTGLLWENGDPVIRLPNPIGFGRDDEW